MLEKLENLTEIDKKILEVAKEEFLENGFFKTNLDNIALKLRKRHYLQALWQKTHIISLHSCIYAQRELAFIQGINFKRT